MIIMIRVKVFRNESGDIYGFRLTGHADYSRSGRDIVCSAVSMLSINTINSIERLTDERFSCETDNNKGGFLEMVLSDIKNGGHNHDVQLLLEAMLIGLNDIKKEYSRYISINEEVL